MVEEQDGSNNVTKRFYSQGEQQSGTSYYYTRDHEGSVREMLNSSGNLLSKYSYDPYGRVTTTRSSDNTSNPPVDATFLYTADYYHLASQLNLTLYRIYDPNIARWLSRDPIAEKGGANVYEYVNNNSINLIDLLGLNSTTSMTIWITSRGIASNANVEIYAESSCCKKIEFMQLTTNILGNTIPDVGANPDSAPFYPSDGFGTGWASMNDAPGPGVQYGNSSTVNAGIFIYNTFARAIALIAPPRQDFVTSAICRDGGPNNNKILASLHWSVISNGTSQKYSAGPYLGN